MSDDRNRIPSTSDGRTQNNVMRHEYKLLSEDEKEKITCIKDKGLDFFQYLESLGSSRELSIAKTHIEDAVMRAVRHITE